MSIELPPRVFPVESIETMADLQRVVAEADQLAATKHQAAPPVLTCAWLVARHPLLGGEYYRALRPAALTARTQGWHTAVCDRGGSLEGSDLVHVQACGPNGVVLAPKVIIARGVCFGGDSEWRSSWIDHAHAAGQIVIADLDDDLWAHEDWTPDTRPNDDGYEDWCWKADGWLVSTEVVKNRVLSIGKERWEQKPRPVLVAPNCYDPTGIGAMSQPSPGKVLGNRLWLSGRMSADLEAYHHLVAPVADELGLSFVHVGAEPGQNLHLDLPRVIERPSSVLPELHKSFVDVSIGMIVHGTHPYNLAKTETNAVELASMGLPLVAATTHPLYANVPGRVDPTPNAVRNRILDLLEPGYWRTEAWKARHWAYSIAQHSEERYLEAVASLINRLAR